MHILIVDDDSLNRKLLTALLQGEGCDIQEASDGLEALRCLETAAYDAIISDVLMPNMDGYTLCAEVRRTERHKNIPFIFYSSTYTDRADESLALEFGGDRFMRKPAPVGQIMEALRQLREEKTHSSRSVLPTTELEVMKQYSQTLIRKLEKRNDQLCAQASALYSSETRLRTIFDAEPDCVYVLGPDGKVDSINPAGLELFQVASLEQLTDCPLWQFVVEKDRAAFQAGVKAVWRGEKRCTEFEIIGAQGRRRWLEMHAAPLGDQQHRTVGLLGIARDQTKRKELEAQFVQAQKMEVVGQLAGGIAHDFNNLLSVILGYAELTMAELSSGSVLHQQVQTMFHMAERAAGLTRQLLLFSREQTTEPVVLDLSELVVRLDPMLRRLISENIVLSTEPELEHCGIEADSGQIEQVLMNLTVNARDAIAAGGKIMIRTASTIIAAGADSSIPAGDFVALSVSDNGSGMTPEIKARIFSAFFTTKPAGKGTGLGLATCQSIVNRWGGHIAVMSEVGAGTTFTIYFPRVSHAIDTIPGADDGGVLPRGEETILLVEDEPGLRELAATVLQKQGYEVLKAAHGEEALTIVRQRGDQRIDLVLTDIVMPEMGGKAMVEWLQATHPELPILFTSGYTDWDLDEAMDKKIEFLPKPYTPSALVRRTRKVIDDARREVTASVEGGAS
jgi:two-component system cell cycle sensor histidine kinase/response regulator CckA